MIAVDLPAKLRERWEILAEMMCHDLVNGICRCDMAEWGPDRCGVRQLEHGAEHPPFKEAYLYAVALDGYDTRHDPVLWGLALSFEAEMIHKWRLGGLGMYLPHRPPPPDPRWPRPPAAPRATTRSLEAALGPARSDWPREPYKPPQRPDMTLSMMWGVVWLVCDPCLGLAGVRLR